MPSINKDFSEQITVRYYDADDELWLFECELPNSRVKTSAIEASRGKRGNKQDIVAFNKVIFMHCVAGWNLEEECTQSNKEAFFDPNKATLNIIAESVVNALMEKASSDDAEISGN